MSTAKDAARRRRREEGGGRGHVLIKSRRAPQPVLVTRMAKTKRGGRGAPDPEPPPARARAKRGRVEEPPSGPRLFVRADDEEELRVLLPRPPADATVADLQAAVETCARACASPRALAWDPHPRFRRFLRASRPDLRLHRLQLLARGVLVSLAPAQRVANVLNEDDTVVGVRQAEPAPAAAAPAPQAAPAAPPPLPAPVPAPVVQGEVTWLLGASSENASSAVALRVETLSGA